MWTCGSFQWQHKLLGLSSCSSVRNLCKPVPIRLAAPRGHLRLCIRIHSSQAAEQSSFGLDLQKFQSWLTANGVNGIGTNDSKIALYTTESGERGLMCTKVLASRLSLHDIMILMLGTLSRIEEACRGGPEGSHICESKQHLYQLIS